METVRDYFGTEEIDFFHLRNTYNFNQYVQNQHNNSTLSASNNGSSSYRESTANLLGDGKIAFALKDRSSKWIPCWVQVKCNNDATFSSSLVLFFLLLLLFRVQHALNRSNFRGKREIARGEWAVTAEAKIGKKKRCTNIMIFFSNGKKNISTPLLTPFCVVTLVLRSAWNIQRTIWATAKGLRGMARKVPKSYQWQQHRLQQQTTHREQNAAVLKVLYQLLQFLLLLWLIRCCSRSSSLSALPVSPKTANEVAPPVIPIFAFGHDALARQIEEDNKRLGKVNNSNHSPQFVSLWLLLLLCCCCCGYC